MKFKITLPVFLAICFFTYIWFSMTKSNEQIKVSDTVLCEDGSGQLAVAYSMHQKIDAHTGCATKTEKDKISIVWNDGETETYDDGVAMHRGKKIEVAFSARILRSEDGGRVAVTDVPCRDRKGFTAFVVNDGQIVNTVGCTYNGADGALTLRFKSTAGETFDVAGTYGENNPSELWKAELL